MNMSMNTNTTKRLPNLVRQLLIVLALLIPTQSWAISLDEAKNKGLVGELTNGYLGHVVAKPSNEVKQLIATINKKRKTAYIKKAKEAGVSLQIMEQNVGKRLINRAKSGHYVSNGKGSWQKK